jgi:hypothetical protein
MASKRLGKPSKHPSCHDEIIQPPATKPAIAPKYTNQDRARSDGGQANLQ